jgi:cytochrome c peroxidase
MKSRLQLLLALSVATVAQAQLPAGSSISFAPGAVANSSRVTIIDPGDHVWTLQSSSDLVNWTNVQNYKVHNGRLDCTTAHAPSTANLFYRTSYSAALQSTITSTLATAVNLPVSPYDYDNPTLPANFAVPPISNQSNMPVTNITTDAGAKLGRILFYDKRLSLNQTVSCSSCHQQSHGFSDPGKFSTGFEGGLTGRNSMGLSNARWYQRQSFFWDERAATLEDQVLQPIQNAVEMGMTLPALEARLGAEPFYVDLFTQVFGTPGVTSDRISKALAQFVRSIISVNSRFDTARTTNFVVGANWTQSEERGRQIFNAPGGCSACHGTDNFVPGPNIFNNGLERLDLPNVDLGKGAITGVPTDNGKFKVGSLRNIELTAPYMHDGRFATLEAVVDFYSNLVVDNPNLSPPLRTPGGGVSRPNFSAQQKADLVNFLKSLTDTSLATNPKYSDPFNYGY